MHTDWGHSKLKLIQIKFNQMPLFEGRGKPEFPWRKPLRAEKRTNKPNPHMMPSLEIRPGPHLGEGSALTTTSPLLSKPILEVLLFEERGPK